MISIAARMSVVFLASSLLLTVHALNFNPPLKTTPPVAATVSLPRRQLLSSVFAASSFLLVPRESFAAVEDKTLDSSAAAPDETPTTTTQIEYDDFLSAMFDGDVEKVQFYGKAGEIGVLTTKKGVRLDILGIAPTSSNSPRGPEMTVAKVRDAKVPFSFESFDLTSFRKVGFGSLAST